MRRSALLALLVPVLLVPAVLARAESIPALFKRVKNSVVVVKVVDRKKNCPSTSDDFDGLGSGVLINAKGQVLTASHVVESAEEILVEFADGEEIPGRLAASSGAADVALIELERPPKIPSVAVLGDSDKAEVGDQVVVVGAPLGISYTLTVGYVSGIREDDSTMHGLETVRYLQTDAAINPGNSGGPMFNEKGEVIGIVSYIISVSGGHEGIGFAVASNSARKLLLQERSVLTGLEGVMLDGEMAAVFNVPQTMGLLVQRVAPNSPANTLGLRPGTMEAEIDGESMRLGGDVLLGVDGIPLGKDTMAHLREHLTALKPGQFFEVSVLRAGKTVTLSAVATK